MTTSDALLPGEWDIVTCEYPPTIGGVSDYTFTLASELATTRPVHVWCPESSGPPPARPNVTVHTLPAFSRGDLRALGAQLDARPGGRQLFVQWVPQGFGYRSLNVGFAAWLAWRAWIKRDQVHLMVHEPYVRWSARPARFVAALVHRVMLVLAGSGARHIWLSTTSWTDLVRPYVRRGTALRWLPVPAPAIATEAGRQTVSASRPARRPQVVGHFSMHSPLITPILATAMDVVLYGSDADILLVGRDSDTFREAFVRARPPAAGRVHATGTVAQDALASHFERCDVMMQPYPDGVTSRRTSTLTLLALGLPIVTNVGELTEPFWKDTDAVLKAPAADGRAIGRATVDLLADAAARHDLAARALEAYDRRFAPRHAAALLNAAAWTHSDAA